VSSLTSPLEAAEASPWLKRYRNLADSRLGAKALSASDEFFAARERMLQPGEPEWRAGVYDENGKWMDGWESRRRRDAGHDHCIIQLAVAGTLELLEIDTRYFTGNYPPFASVEAARLEGAPNARTTWQPLLSRVALRGNERQFFRCESQEVWTHLKLNIYPDGGVARFRAYGRVFRDWSRAGSGKALDLAAALNGGRALDCNDEHYGSNMADGWETRRRRTPGFDWVILALAHRGQLETIEIDTAHFKGNFPHQVSINAALLPEQGDADLSGECLYWPVLLEPQLLKADHLHRFPLPAKGAGPVSHLRVNIHPDGGLSRVRAFGKPVRS
jgi:allantoicase